MPDRIAWPQGFDPDNPTGEQIRLVEAVFARVIGHPIKCGSGHAVTKVIMRGLIAATELEPHRIDNKKRSGSPP